MPQTCLLLTELTKSKEILPEDKPNRLKEGCWDPYPSTLTAFLLDLKQPGTASAASSPQDVLGFGSPLSLWCSSYVQHGNTQVLTRTWSLACMAILILLCHLNIHSSLASLATSTPPASLPILGDTAFRTKGPFIREASGVHFPIFHIYLGGWGCKFYGQNTQIPQKRHPALDLITAKSPWAQLLCSKWEGLSVTQKTNVWHKKNPALELSHS